MNQTDLDETPKGPRRKGYRDLKRAASRDPKVTTYLSEWEHGRCTLEEALIELACFLIEDRKQLEDIAFGHAEKEPAPIVADVLR